jgi:histone H3/H4
MNDIISFLIEEVLEKARIFAMKKYLHPKLPKDEEGEDDDDDDIVNDVGALGVKTFYAYNQPEKIYTDEYDDLTNGKGYTEMKDNISMISSRDIQAACELIYSGELLPHALREGTKALTNYFNSENNNSTFASSITEESVSSRCEFDFSPEVVALVASRMTNGFPMSEYAAVYLAAILEYMTAELLELSGKVSQEKGTSLIGPHHIKLAIDNDEELIKTLKNFVIREGGVSPYFHPILLLEGVDDTIVSKFEELMVAKALAAAGVSNSSCAVFVDPRTGLHMGVTNDKKNIIFPLPHLDEISKQGQDERRRMAQGQLSKEEMKTMKTEGYGAFQDENDRKNEDGWKSESLQRIHVRRLREIKREQSLTDLIFSPSGFENFAVDLLQDCRGHFLYTQEAMEAMQTFLEAYLIELCQEAFLTAFQAGRVSVRQQDFKLARRIRHERY